MEACGARRAEEILSARQKLPSLVSEYCAGPSATEAMRISL